MPEPLLVRRGLVEGRIRQRYKRFLADVALADGTVVTAHTTNTGSMKACWEPGDRVLLQPHDDPKRKLKFTWLACERPGGWVGVETGLPNKVVFEAARRDRLPGLPGLRDPRPEVRYGQENSRIDVWARDAQDREVFIEVKNTTLLMGRHACFPDAVTERGRKHLRELRAMAQAGHVAAIAFFIHRTDATAFDAAREIDPAYADELERAAAGGVQVLPLEVSLTVADDGAGGRSLAWDLPGLLPWVRRP